MHSASGSIPNSSSRETPVHMGYVFSIALAAALGGLLFGYDWVVIGGAKPFFEAYFHLESAMLVGWANSCALSGCLLGSFCAGAIGKTLGRKQILVGAGILFGISSVLTGWSYTFPAFVGWRILGGVAIGLASNISPTYIAEISPGAWRGRMISLNQLAIVVGIVAAQVINWLIANKVPEHATSIYIAGSWNGQYGWRWMFTAITVPAIIFTLCALFIPESPRWLVAKGRNDEALVVLTRIGGEQYCFREFFEIHESVRVDEERNASWKEILAPRLRRVLAIGVGLAVLQQWSGINIFFNYAEEIYKSAGYGISAILLNIIVTGAVNLVFTVVAMGLVDRFGRRVLLLVGCCGIGIAHILAAATYLLHLKGGYVLVLTLCAIAFYAVSLAPVTWVVIAEIFPNRLRSVGVSAAAASLWTASFVLTYSFPLLIQLTSTAGTFILYGCICFVGAGLIYNFLPETKGKSLEALEAVLGTHP